MRYTINLEYTLLDDKELLSVWNIPGFFEHDLIFEIKNNKLHQYLYKNYDEVKTGEKEITLEEFCNILKKKFQYRINAAKK